MKISKFDRWMLKRIFKKIVVQGFDHQSNIEETYKLLRQEAEKIFTEDNAPTLDCFMNECFEASQSYYWTSYWERKINKNDK